MNSKKKTLAFVDLSIHQVTKSTTFIIDIFKKDFDVVCIWYDYGPREGEFIEEISKHDNIFLLQILLPYNALIRLQQAKKNIVWAPMYDGLPMSYYYWEKIASTKIKILSFSGGIDNVCKKHKIEYLSVRYYKKPAVEMDSLQKDKFTLYFWYRGSVKLNDWIHLIPMDHVEKIYYYSAPLGQNFQNEIITPEEEVKYKIEKIALQAFSADRNIFLEYLQKADIFICPRKQDGIGNPLIEAISLGKFIIGNDDYTMKDYIKHNQNGFIYGENTREKISIPAVKSSKEYRVNFACEGYKKWKADEKKIGDMYSSFAFEFIGNRSLKIISITVYEYAKSILKKVLKK